MYLLDKKYILCGYKKENSVAAKIWILSYLI